MHVCEYWSCPNKIWPDYRLSRTDLLLNCLDQDQIGSCENQRVEFISIVSNRGPFLIPHLWLRTTPTSCKWIRKCNALTQQTASRQFFIPTYMSDSKNAFSYCECIGCTKSHTVVKKIQLFYYQVKRDSVCNQTQRWGKKRNLETRG